MHIKDDRFQQFMDRAIGFRATKPAIDILHNAAYIWQLERLFDYPKWKTSTQIATDRLEQSLGYPKWKTNSQLATNRVVLPIVMARRIAALGLVEMLIEIVDCVETVRAKSPDKRVRSNTKIFFSDCAPQGARKWLATKLIGNRDDEVRLSIVVALVGNRREVYIRVVLTPTTNAGVF